MRQLQDMFSSYLKENRHSKIGETFFQKTKFSVWISIILTLTEIQTENPIFCENLAFSHFSQKQMNEFNRNKLDWKDNGCVRMHNRKSSRSHWMSWRKLKNTNKFSEMLKLSKWDFHLQNPIEKNVFFSISGFPPSSNLLQYSFDRTHAHVMLEQFHVKIETFKFRDFENR